jgi:hypothetical protein
MRGKRNQRGISLVGFMMALSLLGFFAFIAMKLFPVYSEFQSVKSDLEGLKAEPNSRTMSPAQLRERLARRFDISYVSSVLPEHITFDKKNGYNIIIKYEVRRPLMYNLDFVAKFEHSVNLAK